MNPCVNYERLLPEQIREVREQSPVAFIPLGTLEWHGPHLPVGLDGLKIHRLCELCARSSGGLVFPPLYYVEPREEGLMDSNPTYRDAISKEMGLASENFAPGYMRRSPAEAVSAYQNLLIHILNQCQSLGFRVLVLAAGHYPLIDHARAAAGLFHQQRWSGQRRKIQPIPWVFTGYELVRNIFSDAGDHAGFWETSLMLALEPELVAMEKVTGSPAPPTAVLSSRPVCEAGREFGLAAVQKIVEQVTIRVRDRLDHPERYLGHGLPLEG